MRKKGFSLLEILITATIIALLAVASVPSLSKLENQKSRANTVSLLSGCLAEAKAKAKSPSDYQIEEYKAVVSGQSCQILAVKGNQAELYNEYLIDSGFSVKEVTSGKPVTAVSFSADTPYNISAQAQNTDGGGAVPLSSVVFIELKHNETGNINTILLNLGTGIITNN